MAIDFSTGYTKICEIAYNSTYENALMRYYELFQNSGKLSYSFSIGGYSFILRLHLNYATAKLHYDILNSAGEFLISFAQLAEAPFNMLFLRNFAGYKMYFSNNKIYLKD